MLYLWHKATQGPSVSRVHTRYVYKNDSEPAAAQRSQEICVVIPKTELRFAFEIMHSAKHVRRVRATKAPRHMYEMPNEKSAPVARRALSLVISTKGPFVLPTLTDPVDSFSSNNKTY